MFARRRWERYPSSSRFARLLYLLKLMWGADEFLALVLYRARTTLQGMGIPVLPRLLHFVNALLFDVRIGDYVVMEGGIYVPHGQVVVDGVVHIRSGCVLSPWTTIGLRSGLAYGPILQNDVMVGTGAKILGNVTIGATARIGANAVVVSDVPAGSVAVGVPARIVEPAGDTKPGR